MWELEMDYLGHPYYVTGNAIYHALGQHLAPDTAQSINASHGMFVPGQFGTFPEEHSKYGFGELRVKPVKPQLDEESTEEVIKKLRNSLVRSLIIPG